MNSSNALEAEQAEMRLREAAPEMLQYLLACADILESLEYPQTAYCIRSIAAECQGKKP